MVDRPLEIRTPQRGMGKCSHCGGTVIECACLEPSFPSTGSFPNNTRVIGPDETIPDVIIAHTDGDDYSVLDKINRNIKVAAVFNPHDLTYDETNNVVYTAAKEYDDEFHQKQHRITEASEETIEAAHGEATKILTPENKHWFLRNMGFKGRGKGKWKHILFDEEIEFDLQTDTLIQLAFKIHKTGYKNAQTEYDQTGVI